MLPSPPEDVRTLVLSQLVSPSAEWMVDKEQGPTIPCLFLINQLGLSARTVRFSQQTCATVQFLCSQFACTTLHPASSLPPTAGPKRREHTVSETRPRQVVLGSGYRRGTENQMPAAGAAGLSVRPPDVSFNFGRSISCLRVPRCTCEAAALLP